MGSSRPEHADTYKPFFVDDVYVSPALYAPYAAYSSTHLSWVTLQDYALIGHVLFSCIFYSLSLYLFLSNILSKPHYDKCKYDMILQCV